MKPGDESSLPPKGTTTVRKSIITGTLALLCLATAAVAYNRAEAGDEKASVTAVAQNYMDAYYTADPAKMERALHPDFHKRTLRTAKGDPNVREIAEDNVQSMIEGVKSGSGLRVPENERVQKIEVLDTYRNAATVKVTTGRWVDYMLITRQNGEWRVMDVVLQYTRQ
jgi:putative lumazine-binding protein